MKKQITNKEMLEFLNEAFGTIMELANSVLEMKEKIKRMEIENMGGVFFRDSLTEEKNDQPQKPMV